MVTVTTSPAWPMHSLSPISANKDHGRLLFSVSWPRCISPKIRGLKRVVHALAKFAITQIGSIVSLNLATGRRPRLAMKTIPRSRASREWFSSYFGIALPQYELPFVDFDLKSDVPLYLDSYAITKDTSDLAISCHNTIHSFFQTLLNAIRAQDLQQVRRLIRGHLSEPDEIHLGVSHVARKGRGIGKKQEDQIVKALAKSEAARKGIMSASDIFDSDRGCSG